MHLRKVALHHQGAGSYLVTQRSLSQRHLTGLYMSPDAIPEMFDIHRSLAFSGIRKIGEQRGTGECVREFPRMCKNRPRE